MGIELMIGRAGSGKTTACIGDILANCQSNPLKRGILIVPEQLSFNVQMEVIEQSRAKGLMNIEILSFNRLAYRIVEENGRITGKTLDDTAKSMIIRSIIDSHPLELPRLYSTRNRKGAMEQIGQVLTEIYNYQWSPQQMDMLENGVIEGINQGKYQEITLLYAYYRKKIGTEYITPETITDLLIEKCGQSALLKESVVIIDGFVGFTPAQQKIIIQLAKISQKVVISLIGDKIIQSQPDLTDLFYDPLNSGWKIIEASKKVEIEVTQILLEKNWRYANAPLMAYLESNIYGFHTPIPFPGKDFEPVFINNYANMKEECEALGCEINRLLIEKGYRYKDIHVFVGELSLYKSHIKRAFKAQNIPVFIDENCQLTQTILGQFMSKVLDVTLKHFSHEALFSFLKSPYSGMENDCLDLLENYSIAYRLMGKKRWMEPLTMPYPNSWYFEESVKESYHHRLEHGQMVLKEAIALIADDKDMKLLSTAFHFQQYVVTLLKHYPIDLNDEINCQSMEKIVDSLNKMNEVFGMNELSFQELCQIFKAAMESQEIGQIPLMKDQCFVGDFKRTKIIETKCLFILGATEGGIQVGQAYGSYMSDYERMKLMEWGIQLARTNREKQFIERINIYHGLFKSKDLLWISYPNVNSEGKEVEPAPLIKRLVQLTGKTTMTPQQIQVPIYRREAAFSRFLSTGGNASLKGFFLEKVPFVNRLNSIREMELYRQQEVALSEKVSLSLYQDTFVESVSRLETYAKCPFMYHTTYHLNLKNRYESELTYPDMGNIYHQCLEKVTQYALDRRIDFSELTEIESDLIISKTIEDLLEDPYYAYVFSTEKNRFFLDRMKKTLTRTVNALIKQIAQGSFKLSMVEHEFKENDTVEALKINLKDKKTMKLVGKIDRVDQYEEEDKVLLKIIDYKSGNETFSYAAVYYGLKLQLLIYSKAMVESLDVKMKSVKSVQPVGLFYYQIKDPLVELKSLEGKQKLEEALFSQLKMQGIVLNNPHYLSKMDHLYQENDSEIFQIKGSRSSETNMLTEKEFNQLLAYGTKKAGSLGEEIISGHIAPRPVQTEMGLACDHCQYDGICKTNTKDEQQNRCKVEKLDKASFFEAIEKEL